MNRISHIFQRILLVVPGMLLLMITTGCAKADNIDRPVSPETTVGVSIENISQTMAE